MKLRILLLLVVLPAFCFAQQELFRGEHFIEVTGSAFEEIEPNEIYLTVRLREFEENKTKVMLEKIDRDFLDALKAAGIDRNRLELADAGSRLGNIGRRDKDAFREKTYQLKLGSAAELERLIDKMEPVRVDFVDVTRVNHSDLEKIRLHLKARALQTARSRAEFLLKSIGATVGKPLMVRDWEIEPVHPMMEHRATMSEEKMGIEGEFVPEQTVGFRKIRIQAQVTAQFQIQ